MLIGSYLGNLGQKRRVAIPKKFLEELGSKLVIAKWYEGCLVIVSHKDWEALLQRLTGPQTTITQGVRDTDRFVLGSAFFVETDNQGRIVIPKILFSYANLTKDIVFLGLGSRVEIWDQKSWADREEYIAKHAAELIEGMSKTDK